MSTETHTVSLPIVIEISKKTKFYLNLNQYRNAHFHILNKAKVLFAELIQDRIKHLPTMSEVELEYVLYTNSNRLSDVANVCCIVDKFFCDTLTAANKLPDDNYQVIKNIKYSFGGVDKNNGRVEAIIRTQKEIPMQIERVTKFSLDDKDIRTALHEYVQSRVAKNETVFFDPLPTSLAGLKITGSVHTGSEEGSSPSPASKPVAQVAKPEQTNVATGPKTVAPSTTTTNHPAATKPAVAEKAIPPLADPVAAGTPIGDTPVAEALRAAEATQPDVPARVDVKTTPATAEAPTGTPQAKSLFGNLTKPVNS